MCVCEPFENVVKFFLRISLSTLKSSVFASFFNLMDSYFYLQKRFPLFSSSRDPCLNRFFSFMGSNWFALISLPGTFI